MNALPDATFPINLGFERKNESNQTNHVYHKEDHLLYDPHAVLDQLRPGLTMTTSVAVGQQGAGGNYYCWPTATVEKERREVCLEAARENERQECGGECRDFNCRVYDL